MKYYANRKRATALNHLHSEPPSCLILWKCVYSILTTNIIIFCCKKRSLCKIPPLPNKLSRMSFVRAYIFHPQWMIISRPWVGVEFSIASNKNWFEWTFLRIFYHTVNDWILEIDSNSSNYSTPVDFTGKPEENLFLYHQSGRSHLFTRSWRKKVFFIQGKAQTAEILLTGKLFPSETNLHSWSSWHVITLCVIWLSTKFIGYRFNLPNNGHNGSVRTSIHSVQNKTAFQLKLSFNALQLSYSLNWNSFKGFRRRRRRNRNFRP